MNGILVKTPGVVLTLALGALALTTPGCAAEDDTATLDAIESMSKELRRTNDMNETLAGQMDRMEMRIDGLDDDMASVNRRRVQAAMAADAETAAVPDAADTAAAAVAGLSAGGEALSEVLTSDKGQEVIAAALEKAEQRRRDERTARMVDSMVDTFAERADLTESQTTDMRKIATASFQRIRDVWTVMRDPDLTDEQRMTARDDAMMQMGEIRDEANEEVKAVLNSAQYEIYEEEQSRMGRMWGGGNSRRGDRGDR